VPQESGVCCVDDAAAREECVARANVQLLVGGLCDMGRQDSELWTTKLTGAFRSFDTDGDGYITAADLDADKAGVAAALNTDTDSDAYAAFEEGYKVWTDQMFADLDKDGDAQISLDEFLSFYSEASTEALADMCERYCSALLGMADADSDDRLSHEEYVRWAMAEGGASEADAEAAFSAIDANGNGYVSKDDLVRSMVEFTVSVEEAPGNELFGPVAA
jgi:Ca2+-binding EF-hand superfamily protein